MKLFPIYKAFVAIVLLMLFACSREELPTITIKHKGPIGWDEKETCLINYQTDYAEETILAKIKCRGGSSSKFWKHSYSLELHEDFQFMSLPVDDDWILNANYIDKTFMRHKISYDLFREMNENNVASKCSYVNLMLNEKYMGLYVLMQEINGGMLMVNKKDDLAMIFKDPPIFYESKLTYVKDSTNYYAQKFPKKLKRDQTDYLLHFKDFLFESSDQEFIKHIDDFVDVNNIMDWHILLLFSNNSDGIMKNFYLYKRDTSTPFRIAIWDYDHSFGRDGDNELNMMKQELDCNRSILLKRLVGIEETKYASKIKARWKELREKDVISVKNFNAHINRNDKVIKEVVNRNFQRWPLDDKWYHDNNTYDQEIQVMKDFAVLRINQLDDYFR
jgi:hypothetical protein